MPSIRDLRNRIRSVQNIQKITRAMKLVAAARQRRAQEQVTNARLYSAKMTAMMQDLVASSDVASDATRLDRSPQGGNEILSQSDTIKHGFLVISGERGMCGSYNTNILRHAMELIRPLPRENVQIIAVGKKGVAYFTKRGYKLLVAKSLPAAEIPFSLASGLGFAALKLYTEHQVDSVHLVYTKSLSTTSQRPTDLQILPVEMDDSNKSTHKVDYIYEPSAPELLSSLTNKYVDTVIYQALLDSNAAQFGAQMVAMSAATDNAKDVVDHLTLVTNRARQAGITTEILDIVGGSEALNN